MLIDADTNPAYGPLLSRYTADGPPAGPVSSVWSGPTIVVNTARPTSLNDTIDESAPFWKAAPLLEKTPCPPPVSCA